MLKEPITIKDFQEGFSNYNGKFERTVNVDIDTLTGSLLVGTRPKDIKVFNPETLAGVVFAADSVTDEITVTNFGSKFFTGQAVTVENSGGALPEPLVTGVVYYVIYVDANTIKLATTLANVTNSVEIDIATNGTGTNTISGVAIGEVVKILRNPKASGADYRFYALDKLGKVWVTYGDYFTYLPDDVFSPAYGMEIYKDYLFVFRASQIDVYGSLTNVGNTATWTNNWKAITTDSSFHPSLVGQDDVMYIGAGNLIVSLEETTTFSPSDSGTYSFNADALNLPENYRIKCLAELGANLAIGTWMGQSPFDFKVADIFLWDRAYVSFELPVRIEENGVNAMITINNLLYVVAGYNGNIYVTDGTSSKMFTKIPKTFFHTVNEYSLYFYPNAIIRHKGKLFLGVGSYTTGVTDIYPLGVLSIDLENGKMNLENTISTGNEGDGNYIRITAMLSVGDYEYYFAWIDNGQTYKYGIDTNFDNRHIYKDYRAYIETGFYQVGRNRLKNTLSQFEIVLNKKLRPNQVIRLSYRTNATDDYTVIGTMNYTGDGAVMSKMIDNSTVGAELVQFKIDFDFSSTETNSPELRSIIIV
jgi:hypothetical protein